MKSFGVKKLLNGVTAYIAVSIFTLMILTIISLDISTKNYQDNQAKESNKQVKNSIEHVIKHFVKEYSYRVESITSSTPFIQAIEKKDREEVLKILQKKFLLMKKVSKHFEVMHIHLADGSSFLRVHQPEHFGDKIIQKRAMLQEIQKSHKMVSGYETGMYSNAYRIMNPIFNEQGKYIGAFELGFNLNFLVEGINDIHGFYGVVFIKENSLLLHSIPSEVIIDGYRLQSQLDKQLKDICNIYKESKHLVGNVRLQIADKTYLTHLVKIKDFKGEVVAKIIFFQNVTKQNPFFNFFQLFIYGAIFFILLLTLWLIRERIKKFQLSLIQEKQKQIQKLQQSEILLGQSQKYLQSIFDAIPTILLVTDGKNIQKANKAMLDFFGFKSLDEFHQEHNCICDFFLKVEGYVQAEVDGVKWLEYIKSNPHKTHKVSIDREGKIYHFLLGLQTYIYDKETFELLSFTDITELEILNNRLEIAVNGTNDGLWDWDLVNNTIYLSPRWKEMLGYKDNELENNFETWKERLHPDEVDFIMKAIEDSHMNPEAEYKFVHRLRHKNGHWVWILDRGQTIFDKNMRAIRMVGFHTDITESKELELKLENAKNQFDLFMNNIPYEIVIKDENYKVIYTNSSNTGLNAIESLGENLGKKIDALSDKAKVEGIAEDVFECENDGKKYFFRTLSFAIPQENGEIYIGVIYINITEQKLLAQELELQHEIMIAQSHHAAMGEMISMIAHQWRQPISVIAMGANNILVDIELDAIDGDSLRQDIIDIINQTKHLSKTIDDFRDFFKPNKVKDEVVVKEVLDDALGVMGKSLENNNIEIESSFHSDTKILIYSRELLQVIINLLKNAKEALVEFRENDRKIFCAISENDKQVIISICDNAGGIKTDILDKVFEPYFTTKDEKNGTGLGLYMSKTIVQKHLLGAIEVQNIDDGACFKVFVPKQGAIDE